MDRVEAFIERKIVGFSEQNKQKIRAFVQFVKFGIVGGINTILSYAIVNGMFYLCNIDVQIGNFTAFMITVFISYLLNSRYVFKSKEKQSFIKGLVKVYISYSITGLFLTAILLYIETKIFHIPTYIATFMNLLITIPVNFILNKFWAFKNK